MRSNRYSYPWPQSKYRAIRNVSTYHSRSPQRIGLKMPAVRLTWPRSIANTPIWQVTLDASSTRVLVVASGISSFTGGHAWPRPLSTERTVKYMANSAAKNISSEESQTMVPTLTRLGLLVGGIQFHEGRRIQP